MKLKDTLSGILGGFGIILYYVFGLAVAALPFVMLDLPFWLVFIFFIIEEIFPLSTVIFWIWGLLGAINGPQDTWATVYYILFAVMFIPYFIMALISFIDAFRN